MMIMKKEYRRFVSLILLVAMIITSFGSVSSVFAEGEENGDETTEEQKIVETEDTEEETGTQTQESQSAAGKTASENKDTDSGKSGQDGKYTQKLQGDTLDEDLVLTISAEQVNKVYKNKNQQFVVHFTAKWNSSTQVKDMENDGWTFTYTLRDQNGKKLKTIKSIRKGIDYKVDKKTQYSIYAVVKKGKTNNPNSPYKTGVIGKFKFPAKPAKFNAKCKATDNNVKLTWSKVKGAAAYYIYRSKTDKVPSKPFEFVEGKTKYTDKNRNGATYRYYVQAVYPKRNTHGFKYQTSSYLTDAEKVKVNKFLTMKIRPIKWVKVIKGGAAILYNKRTGNASHGKLKSGVKVEVLNKYPKKIPRGGSASRIYVKWTKGNKVKKGWISYRKHIKGRVRAQVAYKNGKALDWTKRAKEDYVNKKKFNSKTKYLIWASTYAQKVNVFKGRKGHWKLIKSYRCVSGEFLWPTKLGPNYRIWKKAPRRIRYFVGSTTRKYWYQYLSHFQGGNAFHTVCWLYPGKSKQVNFIKANLQPGTKGCMRMYTPHAVWIYKNVPLNTRVVLY